MSEGRLFSRRLPGVHDALALFAALHTEGQARAFFRRSGGTAVILAGTAIELEARADRAHLRLGGENGAAMLRQLADKRGLPAGDELEIGFALPDPDADEARRIAAASPLDLLRDLAALGAADRDEPYAGAVFTLAGFDHVDMVEALPAPPNNDFPDLVAMLADTLVVVEPSGATRLLATAAASNDPATAHRLASLAQERLARLAHRVEQARAPALADAPTTTAHPDVDDAAFAGIVSRLKEHISAGDIFQAVPSRTFAAPCTDPLAAFRRLVAADPSAYQYYVETQHGTLFGASPETAFEVRPGPDGTVLSVSPIAGTRPRGATPDLDDRMEADLRLDAKEAAEHLMLVDLARNDVARVSCPGTRRATSLMRVERFARVMHLVSTVEGMLAPGRDAIHAMRACLTVGTLSGAPKMRAIELIRSVEAQPRGAYGGAIGILTGAGAFDSAVVIRSAFVADGVADVRAGAGVVAASDPAAEAAETRAKASAVLEALGAAA